MLLKRCQVKSFQKLFQASKGGTLVGKHCLTGMQGSIILNIAWPHLWSTTNENLWQKRSLCAWRRPRTQETHWITRSKLTDGAVCWGSRMNPEALHRSSRRAPRPDSWPVSCGLSQHGTKDCWETNCQGFRRVEQLRLLRLSTPGHYQAENVKS